MESKRNIVCMDENHLDQFITDENGGVRNRLVNQLDRQLIEHCLKRYNNNQTLVAKVLGINRLTLRTRIQNLGIKVGIR